MEEIRNNNTVEMNFNNNITIKGTVVDYTTNRIEVIIDDDYIENAKKVKELDSFILVAHTKFGIKKTYSSVISELDGLNKMAIENNPTIPVMQKREFVRILSTIDFKVQKDDEIYDCKCLNISGGGVAFSAKEGVFKSGENVKIIYSASDFEKEIMLNATICRVTDKTVTAKYIDVNQHDEAKIVKYVFKKSAKRILK